MLSHLQVMLVLNQEFLKMKCASLLKYVVQLTEEELHYCTLANTVILF